MVWNIYKAYQQDILLQQSQAMGGLINTNPMLPSHTYRATTQCIHPSIGFPLVLQQLTQKQIDLIQSPTLCALLSRLHMQSKMSRDIVFLPTKYGGGLKQWSIINQARQIQFVSKTLSSSSIVGFLLQTSLHTTQLEYSHSTNSLATNNRNINISGVTSMWLTCLHKNCMEVGI